MNLKPGQCQLAQELRTRGAAAIETLSIRCGVALAMMTFSVAATQPYPGKAPGPAVAESAGGVLTLKNAVISATWSFKDGALRPEAVADLAGSRVLPQPMRQCFRIATGTPAPATTASETWLGFQIEGGAIAVQSSTNGRGWRTLAHFPAGTFPGKPAWVRLGKMDRKGALSDYADTGEIGSPRFDNFSIGSGSKVTVTDAFNTLSSAWVQRLSKKPGVGLTTTGDWLKLTAPAHCAAFLERKFPPEAAWVRCQIDRANDQGQSWSPGLALVWDDGRSVVVNIRNEGACSVIADGNEQIIGTPFQSVPDYNLEASNLVVFEGPDIVDLPPETGNPREGSHHRGKALIAKLRDPETGLAVRWRAVLRDGSSYIREELTLASPKTAITLTGIQLLDRTLPDAKKLGSVPGSPVIAGNLFFGIEIPVFSTELRSDGFSCGFPCSYQLDGARTVAFSTVTGVVPAGQLRRGFQYYLERERARPARPYLHFNGWYDAAVSETRFLEVIDAYHQELIHKRGVKLDGFVLDDGWDDARNSFWDWNRQVLPHGLTKIRAAAEAAESRLGIWISPLGGYGEAPMRIANARKLGLTDGESLDLSDARYYKWFKEKCLTLMHEDRVGYFKWDKAGDGVNPHFMSLLKLADELHADDPGLFLNVTVGTWPSPFWLNHVDCTWHGGGDVGWLGKGDKREQWLTYRDSSARSVVQRGPLYPLNSIMLHGLVLGHHYQGKTVAEAGNHLKNECRSFFGSGTCMQEIYLSPDLMDAAAWDDLAAAAKWARHHAAVLTDTHMIGGEPAKLEPYGWAAWIPGHACLTLRNPDDQAKSITLDARTVFELPARAVSSYALKSPYKDQRIQSLALEAGRDITLELQPFEVLVFDTGN